MLHAALINYSVNMVFRNMRDKNLLLTTVLKDKEKIQVPRIGTLGLRVLAPRASKIQVPRIGTLGLKAVALPAK
jgi:hypothetical protein